MQINNLKIRRIVWPYAGQYLWMVIRPDGRILEEFTHLDAAKAWAQKTTAVKMTEKEGADWRESTKAEEELQHIVNAAYEFLNQPKE